VLGEQCLTVFLPTREIECQCLGQILKCANDPGLTQTS
jgi:hypothetical protein